MRKHPNLRIHTSYQPFHPTPFAIAKKEERKLPADLKDEIAVKNAMDLLLKKEHGNCALMMWKPADENKAIMPSTVQLYTFAMMIAGTEIMTAFYGFGRKGKIRNMGTPLVSYERRSRGWNDGCTGIANPNLEPWTYGGHLTFDANVFSPQTA